ncbi:hypothetical protein HGRIS_003956 [Hohenbuehelia grisea]|uniref:BHLH domain-containing protein n=1 Tax=Hohenbuehelia grisea TaxID=104357 RepID=A0ABR3JH42_9AGAR
MSILSPTENTAFQSFLQTIDYNDPEQVAPEWSMYSAPDILHDDMDQAHLQKRDHLAKATRDLMSLDSDRCYNNQGQFQPQAQYLGQYSQPSQGLNYQYSPYENSSQHTQTPQMPYTPQQLDVFPFLHKGSQSHQHYPEHALPPINISSAFSSSGPSSRASATPPIPTPTTQSYQIATPTLPSPSQPYMPVGGSASSSFHFPRSLPSPVPVRHYLSYPFNGDADLARQSIPNSLRASPALPPSLSSIHKRSYDEPQMSNKRQRLSPVSAPQNGAALPYAMQRSRSHPSAHGTISHPRSVSSPHMANGHLMHPHMSFHPSRASSAASSRPGSAHAGPQHAHLIGSSKPALLSPSQKKANHIQSEQKRRANIRRGYEALCETVPALREAIRDEDAAKSGSKNDDGLEVDADGKPKARSRPKRSRARGANAGKEESDTSKADGRAGPRSENVVLSKSKSSIFFYSASILFPWICPTFLPLRTLSSHKHAHSLPKTLVSPV